MKIEICSAWYIYFFFGWWWYGRCRWCRKHESTLYMYIYMTGYWNCERCRSRGRGGVEFGIGTVIWALELGGMCFRCLSGRCGLVRCTELGSEIWWVCGGVEKGLFLIRVQQHWKQKRKQKIQKKYTKNDMDDIRMRNRVTNTVD